MPSTNTRSRLPLGAAAVVDAGDVGPRFRAYAATLLAAIGNAGLLIRGPDRPLGSSLLLLLAAAVGLAWFLWEQRRRPLVPAGVVLALSGVLLVLAVIRPPTSSNDVWSYVMYGRIVAVHHEDPYERPPSAFRDDPYRKRVDPVWRHARAVYGPVFLGMAAGAVEVAGDDPRRARMAFQALTAVSVAACLLILHRAARGDPRVLGFVGLNALVVVTTVNNAHNDALVGLAALGAVVLLRRRPLLAGAVLGLAALVKVSALLPAGVLVIWLWRQRDRIGAVRLAAGTGAVTAVGFAVAGSSSLAVLSAARDRMNRGSIWYPVRELLVDLGVGSREVLASRLSTVSMIAVVGLAVVIAVRARRPPHMIVGGAVIAYAVLGAYVFPWYMAWALPVLALSWSTRMAGLALGLAFVLEAAYLPDDRPTGLLTGPEIHTFLQRAQIDLRVAVVPILDLVAVIALVVWSARRAGVVELEDGTTQTGADPPPRDESERLGDGAAGQLRAPGDALGEGDGDLADRRADRRGAVHRLDLEGITVGRRASELDPLDEGTAVDAIRGGVVGDAGTQREPDVSVRPSRERLPPAGPPRLD